MGAAFVPLALILDYQKTGGADPWATLVALKVFTLVCAVLAGAVAAVGRALALRLAGVLVFGALGQVAMAYASVFVWPQVDQLPSVLAFFFFTFLLFGSLLPLGVIVGFFVFVVVHLGVLLDLALRLGIPGVTEAQVGLVHAFVAPGLVFVGLLLAFQRRQARETYRLAQVDHLRLHLDGLSALLNRTSWWARVEARRREGAPGALLMVDIDHFKAVNDTWGHEAGDEAIRRVARCLLVGARPTDLVGRLGGEEFALYLDRTSADEAVALAEALRAAVAESGDPPLTISLGLALDPDAGVEALVRRADAALYAAKRAGRNRLVVGESVPSA